MAGEMDGSNPTSNDEVILLLILLNLIFDTLFHRQW